MKNDTEGHDYVFNQLNNLEEFKTEKDMCDYIEHNMENFITKTLDIDYASHERESYIVDFKCFGKNSSRVDFLITTKTGEKVIMEVKKPRNIYKEVNRAITQVLDYYMICEFAKHDIHSAWIVTTKLNESTIGMIKRFKLPVNICVFSKNNFAIWKHDEGS